MNGLVIRSLLALLAVALLVGCSDGEDDGGEIRTATRAVGHFDAIDMEGSARLEITVGQPVSVSINGPDRAIEHAEVEVHGKTLRIKTSRKDWGWTGKRARIILRIGVPQLASLKLRGGNDVQLSGFQGGSSRIGVDGAARLRASGELDDLTVDMEGAGLVDLSDLLAGDARVTVDGVGQVIVHPRDTLHATMNGVGAILYTGNPREVNTHMNGLGTISHRDRGKSERKSAKEREKNQRREGSAPAWPEEPAPPTELDPDKLQPEYDNRPSPPVSMTEVI